MKQRIAAGAIVLDGDSILMVNHKKAACRDFGVAPGVYGKILVTHLPIRFT